MAFSIRFNEEKNQILKATRGIGYEEVLQRIRDGGLLAVKKHPGHSRANQRIYIVEIEGYAYVVPCVINRLKKEIFLKTIYPSRKYTKQLLNEGGQNAK